MNSVRRQKQRLGCFRQVIWEETANADVGGGETGKDQQRGEWGGDERRGVVGQGGGGALHPAQGREMEEEQMWEIVVNILNHELEGSPHSGRPRASQNKQPNRGDRKGSGRRSGGTPKRRGRMVIMKGRGGREVREIGWSEREG